MCIKTLTTKKLETVKTMSKTFTSKGTLRLLLTVFSVIAVIIAISVFAFYLFLKSETHVRYVGIKNVVSEKISKTAWGMEMNANNVFDEVDDHLDSPDAVIKALESKASLNPEVRGYFAAFRPDYFPEKGTWFEPYVHQTDSVGQFQVSLVGSARHNYTKSDWYIRAMKTHESFWSDPYYYYDGTSISGHYVTYVKPIFDADGHLVCVCGADMTFEWLTKDLEQIDARIRENEQLNQYRLGRSLDFNTIVLNSDGTCISHPEGNGLTITDKDIITDLIQKKNGIADMDVDGEPCMLYYGPIEYVDWSVAVIVPKSDVFAPMNYVTLALLAVAVIGLILVWIVYRRTRYDKAE